jgi:hypothetical protein
MTYLVASAALGIMLLSAPPPATGNAAPAASTPKFSLDETTSITASTIPPPYGPDTVDDSGRHTDPTTVPVPTTRPTTTRSTSSSLALSAPDGFQRVSGPAGVFTVIPAGWSAVRSTGPGALQAADPAGTGRYVKFGGSVAPQIAIDLSHIQYENGFAARSADYRRIALSLATYGGHEAVEWEFEHRDGPNISHVRSLYWRVGGKEYFVLASAPVAQWAQMRPIYDTMVANTDP